MLLCVMRSAAMRFFTVLVLGSIPYIGINKSGGHTDNNYRFPNCPMSEGK
jgi:glutamine synthetase type III